MDPLSTTFYSKLRDSYPDLLHYAALPGRGSHGGDAIILIPEPKSLKPDFTFSRFVGECHILRPAILPLSYCDLRGGPVQIEEGNKRVMALREGNASVVANIISKQRVIDEGKSFEVLLISRPLLDSIYLNTSNLPHSHLNFSSSSSSLTSPPVHGPCVLLSAFPSIEDYFFSEISQLRSQWILTGGEEGLVGKRIELLVEETVKRLLSSRGVGPGMREGGWEEEEVKCEIRRVAFTSLHSILFPVCVRLYEELDSAFSNLLPFVKPKLLHSISFPSLPPPSSKFIIEDLNSLDFHLCPQDKISFIASAVEKIGKKMGGGADEVEYSLALSIINGNLKRHFAHIAHCQMMNSEIQDRGGGGGAHAVAAFQAALNAIIHASKGHEDENEGLEGN